MKYRTKPITIEAREYTKHNLSELLQWALGVSEESAVGCAAMGLPLVIPTLEGDMKADVGDFIIKGVLGEFYPCKPAAFVAKYEPVEEEPHCA
jgi:hypothetical protein